MKHTAVCSPLGCANATACGVTLWDGSENSPFLPGYFQGRSVHLSARWPGSQRGCASSYVGKQLPWLALPCSPSCWELQWTSEPALCSMESPTLAGWESAGWESAVCKQKALGRNHSTAAWRYQRSLAGGHNVYLMVSTLCIYINSNEYFSHIHAPC